MHAIAEGLDAGRNAWRFRLSGEAFKEGSLLLDAKDGHIVEVESNVPNHAEYNDLNFRL